MKTTFGFNDSDNQSGSSSIIDSYVSQAQTTEAKLRIATKGMPETVASDTIVYDVKTQQLYIGNGKGLDPALFSNVHVIENKAALPKTAVANNLYITLEEGILAVYDTTSKTWKQIQSGDGSGIIEKQIQVYANKRDFPTKGVEDKLYIAKDTMQGFVYSEDETQYVSLFQDTYTKAEVDSKIAAVKTVKGDKGDTGENGKSAYELAQDAGYTGTEQQWLASLNGSAGKSAFEIAQDNGFVGDETKWLASLKGEPGATGAAGAPGEQGPKGDTGAQGEKGDKGDTGEAGAVGATGPQGIQGEAGKSAYQVAQDNGFEGTEAEWLASLKGTDGDGKKGDKGDAGESAYQIAVNNGFEGNQTEWLTSLKGTQGEKGEKGDKGDTGEQGQQGEQGIQGEAGKSAYELAVANNFEGNQTEWLASLKGADGKDGAQGEKGETGATGPQGIQGEKGEAGENGKSAYELAQAAGFEGTEAAWLTSLKGEKGDKGEQGEKGETGADADMTNIYTKAEVDQKVQEATANIDLTNYATKDDLAAKANTTDVYSRTEADDTFVKKTDAITAEQVKTIVTENLPDTSKFATKEEVATEIAKLPTTESVNAAIEAAKPDLTEYAKKTDIPDTSTFVTTDAMNTAIEAAKPDLTDYAKKTDIPDLSTYAKAEDVTSKTEIQSMIDAAIEAYKKSQNTDSGKTDGGDSGKTDTDDTGDKEYAWTKYFVVPRTVTNISGGDLGTMKDVFGVDITCTDLVGSDGSDESIVVDTTNTTVEFRILGSIKEDPTPTDKITVFDSFPSQFTWATNFTTTYKDGLRVPFEDLTPNDKVAEYNKILDSFSTSNTGALQYDGEDALNTQTSSAAVAYLYLVRKLKTGTFAEYSVGTKITEATA